MSETIIISDTSSVGFNQASQIKIDEENRIHIVWKKGNNLFYNQSSVINSVSKNILSNAIQISPNPSTGVFQLNNICEHIEVSDNTGQLINTYKDIDKIDLYSQPAGFYYLKILYNNELHSLSVILL